MEVMRAKGNARLAEARAKSFQSVDTHPFLASGETNVETQGQAAQLADPHRKEGMVEAAIWERTDQKTGQTRHM